MDSKIRVLHTLKTAAAELKKVIYAAENDQDCIKIHFLLKKAISLLQQAKRELLSLYLDQNIKKLFKNNDLGEKAGREVINLFQT